MPLLSTNIGIIVGIMNRRTDKVLWQGNNTKSQIHIFFLQLNYIYAV